MNGRGIARSARKFATTAASHRRAVIVGMVAALAAATAAGAAPSTFTPWSDHHEPTAASQTTLLGTEPTIAATSTTVLKGPGDTTTAVPAPTSTEGSNHEPSTTVAPQVPPPTSTQPASVEPPHTMPPPPPPSTTLAPHTEPSTTLAGAHETPPSTTEVKTPATLQLACTIVGEHLNNVDCEWTGPVPAGFSRFLLLRGNQTAKGRVPFASGDPSAHSFIDLAVPAGSYTYVLVVVDASGKSIAHSSLIPITIVAVG